MIILNNLRIMIICEYDNLEVDFNNYDNLKITIDKKNDSPKIMIF